MTRNELRLLADFLWATENEIVIDRSLYKMLGMHPAKAGYLPRPSKFISRLTPWQRRVLAGVGLLRILWRIGGGAFFLFLDFLKFIKLLKVAKNGKAVPVLRGVHSYGVLFSERAAGVINQAIPRNSLIWITLPWVMDEGLRADAKTLNILELLTYRDLLKALSLSIKAVHCLGQRPRTKNWVFQSYTAFRWMFVRLALAKIDTKSYVIAEHYDRWACLIDSVVRFRSGKAGTYPDFTIVQHGSLASLNADQSLKAELPFRLRSRHRSVSAICVYDKYSRDVFFNSIVSKVCATRGVAVSYFQPKIILSEVGAQQVISVLFVGHPLCEKLHIDLCRGIGFRSVTSFYKPHPTSPPSNEAVRQSWCFIEGRESFPSVDLLISYPSTLVDEYAAHGVPAVLHSLNESEVDRSALLQQILSRLDSLIGNKNDVV